MGMSQTQRKWGVIQWCRYPMKNGLRTENKLRRKGERSETAVYVRSSTLWQRSITERHCNVSGCVVYTSKITVQGYCKHDAVNGIDNSRINGMSWKARALCTGHSRKSGKWLKHKIYFNRRQNDSHEEVDHRRNERYGGNECAGAENGPRVSKVLRKAQDRVIGDGVATIGASTCT